MSHHQRVPYVRPLELGASNEKFFLRIVQDGTRTVAEVYVGVPDEYSDRSKPVGIGHSVRRKGERRKPDLGVSLATGRALQEAGRRMLEASEKRLNG